VAYKPINVQPYPQLPQQQQQQQAALLPQQPQPQLANNPYQMYQAPVLHPAGSFPHEDSQPGNMKAQSNAESGWTAEGY